MLLALGGAGAIGAQPLSDGTSASLDFNSRPGVLDLSAQQNLLPYAGISAGYQKEIFDGHPYAGWMLGSDWRLARFLSSDWRAVAILGVGLAGMQDSGHGHLAAWSRLALEWEGRRFLVAARGRVERGNQMPNGDEGEWRVGYSPLPPSEGGLQPWFVLSYFARSGTGEPQPLAIFRLVQTDWWVEVGMSIATQSPTLSAAVAL